jgi:hypothetical protein
VGKVTIGCPGLASHHSQQPRQHFYSSAHIQPLKLWLRPLIYQAYLIPKKNFELYLYNN